VTVTEARVDERGERAARYRIGVDVGGTFTDLFLWSPEGGGESFKVLSTPQDPSVGVVDGLRTIAESRDLELGAFLRQVRTIVHGTTVATNAVLTRRGGKTGLITTQGVRDALEMRRGIREEQYNNRFPNVVPLVPRHLRQTVRGRLDYQGAELEPLALEEVRATARRLGGEGVSAVAICFMNAFASPIHEQAAAEVVRAELPDAYLSVSSELLPTVRFYNRTSTTVLNAYVGPVLRGYLRSLTTKLAGAGFGGVLLIMQSNGGVALPEVIDRRPAMTLLSGPAAGPRAGVAFTEPHGRRDCIVVDMGGTSFDASLVRDGAAAMTNEGEIDRLRIALPMLSITTIGAGGGSIGWLDEGGLLRMGPQSAGALPGPACYGRGGELPACTDADLVLGYLDPDYFAGGKLRLDRERARAVIEARVARPLKLDLEEAAAGMYRVINANMAHGVREITIKRGLDPREFPMVVAGGAGAIHACMIADELEMPTLLVPGAASTLCAAGMLLSDLQHDFVRTCITALSGLDPARLKELVQEMTAEGLRQLRREGIDEARSSCTVALDLRYLKQYHEVTLPVPLAAVENADLASVARAFHAEHNRLYGYDLGEEGTPLELINVRVRTIGHVEPVALPRLAAGTGDPEHAAKRQRRAFVPERAAFAELPVYDGHKLLAGDTIPGPALIERVDTTILVTASYGATIDAHGSCLIERARRESEVSHG
jgi:N-methylhydantoinase A